MKLSEMRLGLTFRKDKIFCVAQEQEIIRLVHNLRDLRTPRRRGVARQLTKFASTLNDQQTGTRCQEQLSVKNPDRQIRLLMYKIPGGWRSVAEWFRALVL